MATFNGPEKPSQPTSPAQTPPRLKYYEVGANLTDPIFRGTYHGRKVHEDDLAQILSRAEKAGCTRLMVTGSTIEESEQAIELARQYPNLLTATTGIHPCSSSVFSSSPPDTIMSSLRSLLTSPSSSHYIAAYGEFGLDYDRLHFCDKETQQSSFKHQLDLASSLTRTLPLFLHSRAAHVDFVATIRPYLDRLPRRGLVHSFTGNADEMLELVGLGFDIGVNGCSLKTEENLEVVRQMPMERLQLETDAPWCEVRASSAGLQFLRNKVGEEKAMEGLSFKSVKKEKWSEDAMVKGRNEPCTIGLVARIVAAIKGLDEREVADRAWDNSVRMFDFDRTAYAQ